MRPRKIALLSFERCILKLLAKVTRFLIARVALIDAIERLHARGNGAERDVPPIAARLRLTSLGEIDFDLGKRGRDVGRPQILEDVRRVVQGLNPRRLIEALWRAVDGVAALTTKAP